MLHPQVLRERLLIGAELAAQYDVTARGQAVGRGAEARVLHVYRSGGGGLWKVETVKLRAADTYDVIMASTASKTKKNTTITAILRGSTVTQERGQIHGKAAEMRPTTF